MKEPWGNDSGKGFTAIIEKAGKNFSAYVPDIPGCVATGKTLADVKRIFTEALDFHLQGLAEDGQAGPPRQPRV